MPEGVEAAIELAQQLRRTEYAEAGPRQFQRQRHELQGLDQLFEFAVRRGVVRQLVAGRFGAFADDAHAVGQRAQWRDAHHALRPDLQGCLAGGEHPDRWSGVGEQGDLLSGAREVLEVVQQEERGP